MLLLMSIMSISINVKSVSKKTIKVWNVYKSAASIEFHQLLTHSAIIFGTFVQ